jgi:N12 class adenine-specific DNA methylase
MMHVRDAIREVFRTQLDDAPEEEITAARRELNRIYDAFVREYGCLNSRENLRVFAGDPDQPLLLSLENYNPGTKTATKTAIFDRRTLERHKPVEKVETATEALTVSLNETGGVDWPRMEQLTGRTERQLQRELGSLVYENPEGGWETADRYLSGDVRARLRAAESAADLNPSYARNVEALKAVQPKDLEPGEIEARLGASWIPASDIEQFVVELLETYPNAVSVAHSNAIASWSIRLDHGPKHDVANTTTYGTARAKASELIEDALNGRTPTIYDQLDAETRVINQQKTLAARKAAGTERQVPRMGVERPDACRAAREGV